MNTFDVTFTMKNGETYELPIEIDDHLGDSMEKLLEDINTCVRFGDSGTFQGYASEEVTIDFTQVKKVKIRTIQC